MQRHRGGADEIFINRSGVCKAEQTWISHGETESISLEKVRERKTRREERKRESNWLFWFLDQDKETRRSWAVGNKDLPDGPLMGSIQAGGDL